nr:ribonuclease H-like domain, reverse transcriptase, RNA-dependent DNA polymerase [Tanacetum cinerariifolium]
MGYEKPPPKLTFYKAFFSTQWKFLIHTLIQCLSAKRTVHNEFSCSMASAVICLSTGRKFNFSKYIFDNMVRNVDSPSVEIPLFAVMLVQPQPKAKKDVEIPIAPAPPSTTNVEIPIAPAPPSTTSAPLPADIQDPMPTPYATPSQDQPLPPHDSPPQDQPTTPHAYFILLLITLMETYATLSQKVAECSGGCIQTEGKIKSINAYEVITLVDVETDEEVVAMDVESQGRRPCCLMNLVKEKISLVVPSEDKEQALSVKLKRVHHVSSTRGHDIFMLTEKDYPLSNAVMILMLSGKLQVEEDTEMVRDLVMKIFIEANKPRSRSLDTSS